MAADIFIRNVSWTANQHIRMISGLCLKRDSSPKNEMFWKKIVTRQFWVTIDFQSRKKNTMEVNGAPELLCFPHSSEYLPLCSAEQRHSYWFKTTWDWVNDDRIFIFGWTIPLSKKVTKSKSSTSKMGQCNCVYEQNHFTICSFSALKNWPSKTWNHTTIFKRYNTN